MHSIHGVTLAANSISPWSYTWRSSHMMVTHELSFALCDCPSISKRFWLFAYTQPIHPATAPAPSNHSRWILVFQTNRVVIPVTAHKARWWVSVL